MEKWKEWLLIILFLWYNFNGDNYAIYW
jgi:hypothetical protein